LNAPLGALDTDSWCEYRKREATKSLQRI